MLGRENVVHTKKEEENEVKVRHDENKKVPMRANYE